MSICLILRMFIPQLIKRFSRSTRSGLKGLKGKEPKKKALYLFILPEQPSFDFSERGYRVQGMWQGR